MKTLIAILVSAAVTAGAALLLFYLPERGRLLEAQEALTGAEARLAEARSLLTVHALHDEVLALVDGTQDPAAHERAMALSTRFFDLVRAEAARTASEEVRTVLSEALARRDPVVRAALDEIRRILHPLLRAPEAEAAPRLEAATPEAAPAATGPSR
jgi:hypothetical protein